MFINKKIQEGVTYIEIILAIVIIGISIAGLMKFIQVSASHSADNMPRMQAVLIAESLMDEVLSKNFSKPNGGFTGPFIAANRSLFDTVTDYNGLTLSGISILNGTNIPNLSNYSATISVTNVSLGNISSSNVLLVDIVVNGPNIQYHLEGYKINV